MDFSLLLFYVLGTVLIGSSIPDVIVKHAEKSGSDLIVIGAPQAVVGSVSAKVMHLSEVPVLMVK